MPLELAIFRRTLESLKGALTYHQLAAELG
jgi:hypothetical protein